jgi:type VI secretion system protein ImpH
MGAPVLIRSAGLPHVRLLRFAGVITQRPHSAHTLAGILRDYFALPGIDVEQCVERWVPIHAVQRNRLGRTNCALGRDLCIGERVRDRMGKLRIRVGPLGLRDFMRFLPVAEDYAAMVNLVRLYATDRLDFDIRVALKSAEIPPLRLSSRSPLQLGWNTCLPGARPDLSLIHRQPAVQSPKTQYSWPGPALPATAGSENRGEQ